MSDWTWYAQYHMYFSPTQNQWARANDRTGIWEYVSAGEGSTDAARKVGGQAAKVATEGRVDLARDDLSRIEAASALDRTEHPTLEGVTTLEDVGWSFDLPGETTDPKEKKGMRELRLDLAPVFDTSDESPTAGSFSSRPAPLVEVHQDQPTSSAILRLVIISTSIPAPAPAISSDSSSNPASGPQPKVAIITATTSGVQIGRDKAYRPRIRLKELEVSKVHANVYWSDAEGKEPGWFVVDSGSTHGTFLLRPDQASKTTPARLSQAKASSPPHRLVHLSQLTIGSTTFECHIHKDWPCEVCALGDDGETINTAADGTTTTKVMEGAPSLVAQHLATFSGESTTVRATASPIVLANPNGDWKEIEARRVALTAQAKRDDTTRRSKLAMRNLKASFFGEGDGSGRGGGGGRTAGGKRKAEEDSSAGQEQGGLVVDGHSRKRKAQESGGNAEPLERNRFLDNA